jgi:long-chain acyl-CoA synthetase
VAVGSVTEMAQETNFHAKIQPPAGIFAQGEMRFVWHAQARLFGPDGQEASRVAQAAPVIPPQPAPQALAVAFAAAEAGIAFRIGGPPDAPAPGTVPMFETLTGGSTGAPRRIRRTQGSWIASFRVNAGLFGIAPGMAVAVPGDLGHSLPLYAALEALHLGADLHLLGGLRPDRQVQALAVRRATVLYATPSQVRALTGGAPNLHLRQLVIGGGALDPALRAAFGRGFPNAAIATFYGAAETSFVTLSRSASDGAGAPYPGVCVALRDLAPDGAGEVWVQSPYLADGYAGDPGALRQNGGWVGTGDWGRWQEGALHILGRSDRRVRIADQSVFPEEIEAFIASLPGVADVAVLPVPDPRRGQVLVAVLRGDPDRAATILGATRKHFGPLAAPRRLHWRDDWPLLASGKPDIAHLLAALS